jgi:NAD(P)-dependent dehydrogenase (short-subunit alcohol dehydrogenase family)
MADISLANRGLVITGGGSGIGAKVARRAVDAGARVAILDLKDSDGVANGRSIHYVACDVTDETVVAQSMATARERLGQLDGVFANAGIIGVQAPVEDLTPAEWRQTLDVCLNGVFYTIHAVIPHLTSGGAIVATSSITGTRSFATEGAAAYAAAKAGVAALVQLAAVELGRLGIRVNAIAPGAVLDTHLWEEWTRLRNLEKLAHERLIDAPLRNAETTSDDIADLVLFLLSDLARRISGAVIHIDGAQSLLGGGILKSGQRQESSALSLPPPSGSRLQPAK